MHEIKENPHTLGNNTRNEVEYKGSQNTKNLLATYSLGFSETTCFGLLWGHHQVYRCKL